METRVRPAKAVRVSTAREIDTRSDRRMAILLAAEKLFAQHGYHAVTIRQIAIEAEVPLALVGYYYGQKHALFEAIFAHWSPTIAERLSGLRVAVDTGGPDLLRHIVEAFVQPVLRMRASAEGEFYALLVARELSYASPEADRVLHTHFDPMARAYIAALQVALPHIGIGEAAWAYQFALGALLHHMSDQRVARLSGNANTPNDQAAHPMLVRFIDGGIRAAFPPSSVPPAGVKPATRTRPHPVLSSRPSTKRRPP
ncbi:MAG: TetR family transcriptional regulator [Burkholderiaceae bacterium]